MKTTNHTLPTLLMAGALLLATPSAQQPAAASDAPTRPGKVTIEALARTLDTAHRPNGPIPPIDSFRCNLELHLVDARAEQCGQVDLAVQFLLWQRAGSKKVRPLMRYEIRGTNEPMVRGRDQNGPWQLSKGEPLDLTSAELVQDLEQCNRHINLCRQLLRFLSPGKVLRGMQQPGDVEEQKLVINERRGIGVACLTVAGRLDQFPLLQQAGDDAPVQMKVFVNKASGQLLAVDVWPLLGDEPDEKRGERILLLDLVERNGLLVPGELDYLFRDDRGQLNLNSRVKLPKLDLRPGLQADDFDRSRK